MYISLVESAQCATEALVRLSLVANSILSTISMATSCFLTSLPCCVQFRARFFFTYVYSVQTWAEFNSRHDTELLLHAAIGFK